MSFDLEEFINLSSGTWNACTTSFEGHTGGQTEYYNEATPHMWDIDGFEWMEATGSFEMPLGDLSLTAAQPNLPSAPLSQSNVFISFEEFEQFIYPTANISSGSSSTSSAASDGSSPTPSTSDQQSPDNHSTQPSPNSPSDSDLTCSFCAKTFEKRHMLTRHRNQHIKPIPCPISGCSHRTAKKRDMQRHVIVHHATEAPVAVPKFICPVVTCKHSETGFKRRDHLVRHVKKLHPGISF